MLSKIFLKNYNLDILIIILLFFLFKKLYIYYCKKITFNRLEKLFPRNILWEKDLEIYSIAMPRFFTNLKKNKCILLISGYRDIPFLWSELIKHFENEKLDYYAPRTNGNGRSFFQNIDTNEWIITYLEAIHILQDLYFEIDIIGFSAGCVIALYLSQFQYKCKINNIILCAPFLEKKKSNIDFFINSKWSFLFTPIINFFMPFRIKNPEIGYKYPRDIHYEINVLNDYYELVGFIKLEIQLLNFKNLRPKKIYADNIYILYPNDDKIIGNIYEQQHIITSIFNKYVPVILIPSFDLFDDCNKPILCGHTMFKEHPLIINNIFTIIKNIIDKNYCIK